MTPGDLLPAIFLAAAVALALPSPVSAAAPRGGLQEVPLGDLQTDHGGVCSARPAILVKNFGEGSDPAAYLDAAQACGAKVVVYFSQTIVAGRIHPELVGDLVATVKGHPALYGYLTVKEPSLTGVSGAEIRALYAAFKRADPSRPVVALLTDLAGVGTARNPLTRGMADVVMFDRYPIGTGGYRSGTCATLSRAAALARAIGARVWIMVQAHRYDAGGKAEPTPAQMRRQISDAVSCARAGTVVAHIWSHAAYQSDLRRNSGLFAAFLGATS